ncbi:hypothetical protein EDB81DRAFT_832448 [Dactylonectria macrodidyma]|uniref:Uncharacterized protein n=1 Tax=Dactylonectria macrodidyma TaxID=307937 RepID=A0A9P9D0F6_9HYPO|nr:hypothetical protein EDB81DRAFT_832448 [Dactylonectria macrodidyma]
MQCFDQTGASNSNLTGHYSNLFFLDDVALVHRECKKMSCIEIHPSDCITPSPPPVRVSAYFISV